MHRKCIICRGKDHFSFSKYPFKTINLKTIENHQIEQLQEIGGIDGCWAESVPPPPKKPSLTPDNLSVLVPEVRFNPRIKQVFPEFR